MNHSRLFVCCACIIFLSACSGGSAQPNLSHSALPVTTSTTQIQKPLTEISCEDLKNPAYQGMLIQAINEIRQHPRQCGQTHFPAAAALVWNPALYQGASVHAEDMATHQFLGHNSSTGLDLRGRLKRDQVKTRGGGENVARGQKNLADVMQSWLSSPVHCSNLMQSKFTDYAIACAVDQTAKSRPHWVQQFGIR